MAPNAPEPEQPTPAPPRLATGSGEGARELVLVKNGQRYVFRCAPGEEKALLARLGEMVGDPKTDLNWFDVAVLSHQIGQRMGSTLRGMHKPQA